MTSLILKKHPKFSQKKRPLVLIIMDGIGIGPKSDSNAVHLATTPFLDSLSSLPLYTELQAHGIAVGMPSNNDMGNSEVGHNALGAGRIFKQGASLVNNAINSRKLFKKDTWITCIKNCLKNKSTLHFIGLLSDGNVHSHINHLKIMIEEAVKMGQKKIRLHILLDGRDVGQKTALNYIENIHQKIDILNISGADIKIASGGGRMVTTMDRYNADWTIVERGWKAHVLGEGRAFKNAIEAISTFYDEDPKITDQYLPSFVITENNAPVGKIIDNDSVVMTNFRGDRAIEISLAFESEKFEFFDRKKHPKVFYAGMMEYDGDLKIPRNYLVSPPEIDHPLSEYLCKTGIRSFAISETQKFGHVTYFWNGNKSGYIDNSLEKYVEIPSDKIPFDERPEMKAKEITDEAIKLLSSQEFDFGRINYPNGDMVGHTGNLEATIRSVIATEKGVKRIVDKVNELGGITIILADHGNAECMFTEKNGIKIPKTSHTLNPVPFAIIDQHWKYTYRLSKIQNSGLTNIAATICNLLGYYPPENYNQSLITPT